MNTDTKPADTGQETEPSLVTLLEKHTRALVRMTAVLTRISGRLAAIERDLDIDDADTAVDNIPLLREPANGNEPAPFAMAIDGRVLLHLSYLEDEDVSERDHWIGIVLSPAESVELLEYLGDGAADAAGRMGGAIRTKRKAARPANDDGEQEGGES